MYEYRARKKSSSSSLSGAPTPTSTDQNNTVEYWETLALSAEYGLDDDDTAQAILTGKQSVKEEFIAYSTSALSTPGLDLVKYWECMESIHPTIFDIALDFLPIQASAISSERVFSSSAKQAQLHPSGSNGGA